jgi:gliding-associated putative ABC transporter substrate-binding component GldG
MDLDRFNENDLPLAYLLEGSFTSPYANRLSRENEQNLRAQGMDFKGKSSPTSMIIIADGDVLANRVTNKGWQPLGVNPWEKFQYANKALMLNAIEYLMNPDGVIAARGKDVKLRLIDKEAAIANANKWRTINLLVPMAFLAIFGLLFNWFRRRKYAQKG